LRPWQFPRLQHYDHCLDVAAALGASVAVSLAV